MRPFLEHEYFITLFYITNEICSGSINRVPIDHHKHNSSDKTGNERDLTCERTAAGNVDQIDRANVAETSERAGRRTCLLSVV
jgi:hypothetical protein